MSVPVVADADTGYGNVINMRRTVREFEQAGAAAIYFEDQVAPKKCGHFQSKSVIPKEEMVAKIRAAVEARQDPDFVLIARTDAVATHGIDEAISRVNAYHEAGADVVYIDAPESEEQVRRIGKEVNSLLMFNQAEGGKTPLFSVQQLQEMSFKIVSFSNSLMRTAAKAMVGLLTELKETGTTETYLDRMISFEERNEIVGLPEISRLEERYKTTVP